MKRKEFPIIKLIANILVCKLLYRVTYENIEELDKYDKCIICPNHSNIFDPVHLFVKTDNIYFMAKEEIFKTKLLKKIFQHYHVFPIKREKHDTSGIRTYINLLEQNDKIKLLMFPEGGIIKNNREKKKMKIGAVYLSELENIPIIPVHITESPKLFHKIKITIMKEINPENIETKDKQKIKEKTDKLFNIIYQI